EFLAFRGVNADAGTILSTDGDPEVAMLIDDESVGAVVGGVIDKDFTEFGGAVGGEIISEESHQAFTSRSEDLIGLFRVLAEPFEGGGTVFVADDVERFLIGRD